jgi:hypothetical protein
MGGTTEHAGNFVPIDERLVSFFVSQKPGVQRTQSFAGVWGVPTNFFFILAAAGGKKGH